MIDAAIARLKALNLDIWQAVAAFGYPIQGWSLDPPDPAQFSDVLCGNPEITRDFHIRQTEIHEGLQSLLWPWSENVKGFLQLIGHARIRLSRWNRIATGRLPNERFGMIAPTHHDIFRLRI